MSLRPKKQKRKKVQEKYISGKYYKDKGYYLDGEFLKRNEINYGRKAYRLGQVQVELHRKRVGTKFFIAYCKYWAARKLSGKNSNEIGTIEACKEYLKKRG